jgi:O-antigen/teichoic acid export membrane protein
MRPASLLLRCCSFCVESGNLHGVGQYCFSTAAEWSNSDAIAANLVEYLAWNIASSCPFEMKRMRKPVEKEIPGVSFREKIFKNISWLFIDKIIRIFGGLVVGIWVARYLGPNDYGVLNFAIAYITLFVIFVKIGLDHIVIREIVKNPKLTNYILGTAFGLKLIGAIIATVFVYYSLNFINIDYKTEIVIYIMIVGFIFQSLDVIDYFYQAKVLSKYVVIVRNGAFLLSSLLKIYFMLNQYSVIYIAFASVIDTILSSLFLVMVFQKTKNEIKLWRFSNKIAIKLFSYSWSLALSTFLISVHMKIDQVMIGNMLDAKQVGIYSIAVRLSEFWLFIPMILVNSLFPYFVKLKENNVDKYHSRLMQLYSIMFWMGVFVGIVTIIFGEYLIEFIFGEAFVAAYSALIFNIWSGIFMSLGVARGIWILSENLQKYRLYNNLMVVSLNIILNILLIPKMGISGAALASLITQSSGVLLFSFIWKPLRASTWAMIKSTNPIFLLRALKAI